MHPPHDSVNVASLLVGMDSANSLSTKRAIEYDVAQVDSIGDDIASLCVRHCTIRNEVGSSGCEKKAADDSAISERMWVRNTMGSTSRQHLSSVSSKDTAVVL